MPQERWRMMSSLSGKLDETAGPEFYYVYCEPADLHMYQPLLLRASVEPLRQWSGCVRVDDHTVI
jgi:hypothetical protein